MSLSKQPTAAGELPRGGSTMTSGITGNAPVAEKSNELIAVNGKPLDFSFKNICDLSELKSVEARSGKRKPIITGTTVVVEEEKKFGVDDDESKKEGEDNEREDLKEKEESKEGEEGGDKAAKEKKEEKKKPERKEPEIIRAIPSNTTSNIITSNHVPLNTGSVKTVGGKIVEEGAKTSALKASKKVTQICTSLILSYNKIRSIDDFYPMIDSVMLDCSYLGFLDISHNYLQTLGCDFSQFPNLKILYLHCNYIKDLAQISQIRAPLISLTIHGNPVEQIHSFRQFIISVIPTLKNLDTAPISKKERDGNDSNIRRLLLKVPPPVDKAPEPPAKNAPTTNNSNGDQKSS